MKERLDFVWDRLERAQEHFEVIKDYLCGYYRSCTDGVSGYFDPQDDGLHMSPGLVTPDIRMHTLVGEFLHDLRSTLDHLAWQMVMENGGTPTDQTTFPILRIAPTPNKKGISPPPPVIGGVSAPALAIIKEAQPYKWQANYPKHPLYRLHELWNIDKHRHIVAQASRLDEFVIEGLPPAFTFTLRVTAIAKDGAEIKIVPNDPAVKVNAQATLRVIVNEPGKQILCPLWDALKGAREAVLTIVSKSEDRCF